MAGDRQELQRARKADSTRRPAALVWAPRVLGLAVALFIGAFALDEVGAGWVPFLIHAAPALVLLGALALSWRWEWIGALVNIALGIYLAARMGRHVGRILLIPGPLLLTGLLFLWSWWRRRDELHQPRASHPQRRHISS